jgi:hypothetical protein
MKSRADPDGRSDALRRMCYPWRSGNFREPRKMRTLPEAWLASERKRIELPPGLLRAADGTRFGG